MQIEGEATPITPHHMDWRSLAAAARPVVLVMRAPDSLARVLAQGKGQISSIAADFLRVYGRLNSDATSAGCTIAGLQIDYDCPTARLADYRALLENLRPSLAAAHPGAQLSITALPTWMQSKSFGPLVRATAWYTLQIHGIERPTTIEKPIVLCDAARIVPWAKRASSFGVPFLVALPSYGYRVIFDGAGKFTALVAEGAQSTLRSGFQERLVEADPQAMAATMRMLRAAPPANLRGVVWFRLPIPTDRLNWPWLTLAAVMDGRNPALTFAAELRHPDPGLYEVWLRNTGQSNTHSMISLSADLTGYHVLASDTTNGFDLGEHGILTGPAPPLGSSRLAAWFRITPDPNSRPIPMGEVQVLP